MITATTEIVVVEHAAKKYSDARATLCERVNALEDEVRAVRNRHLRGIKLAAGVAAQRKSELVAEIAAAPHLFAKPRTFTLHGVKVGFQKGKGRVDWEDDAKVVRLIRSHYAEEQAELLIITTETPSKDALAKLPANELRRLGVTLEEAGDAVVVKAVDGEIDKLVAKILEEGAQAGGDVS